MVSGHSDPWRSCSIRAPPSRDASVAVDAFAFDPINFVGESQDLIP